MSIRGIILIIVAILGAVLNFASRYISEKTSASELKIKVCALIIVLISMTLLFIFGK